MGLGQLSLSSASEEILMSMYGICGDRLTRAYDITIQIYHQSHTKSSQQNRIFCGVWVQILSSYIAYYMFYEMLKFWRIVIS